MYSTDALRTAPEHAELSAFAIAARFCGPPGTGNGGYVAGRLASRVDPHAAVEVTLRRPVPLATPLFASREHDGHDALWTLHAADADVVAEARTAAQLLDCEPPLRPRWSEIPRVAARTDHPFPGCFVCGPGRAQGDGLRLAPTPVGDGAIVAARWTPSRDLADATGDVDAAVVWAALDCPGYFGIVGERPLRPLLLGRMTARIEAPLRAGERCVVVGWALASQGRRHEAATALLDRDGRVRARSRQVWIEPRP